MRLPRCWAAESFSAHYIWVIQVRVVWCGSLGLFGKSEDMQRHARIERCFAHGPRFAPSVLSDLRSEVNDREKHRHEQKPNQKISKLSHDSAPPKQRTSGGPKWTPHRFGSVSQIKQALRQR